MGPVIEGPPALWVAAGLEPGPGSVPLSIANDEQELEELGWEPAIRLWAEVNLPAGLDPHAERGRLSQGLQGGIHALRAGIIARLAGASIPQAILTGAGAASTIMTVFFEAVSAHH